MSCMCGDTHCGSCGPAQGNSRCPICGVWNDDGCEHFNEETGEVKPEFQTLLNEAIDLQCRADAQMMQEMYGDGNA